jgi:hypothetical protein
MHGGGHSLSHDRSHGLHGGFVEAAGGAIRLVLMVAPLLLLVPVVVATRVARVQVVAAVAFPAAAVGPESAESLELALRFFR